MGGSSEFRWPVMGGHRTRIIAAGVHRRVDTEVAVTDAAAAAPEDVAVADPGAGAALGLAVDPATVGPSPDPAHAPDLAPPPSLGLPGDPSPSRHPSPGPDPDRGPDPDLEPPHQPQRGNLNLDPGLRAPQNLLKRKELYPLRKKMHQINEKST